MTETLFLLLVVPLTAAFVGWSTNWLAVKMIFNPERFVGIGPIGWQGVLPRRASKFAAGVADTITTRLISAREMAERLDPAEMEKQLSASLDAELPKLCADAAEIIQAGAWEKLPEPVRAMIVAQARQQATTLAHEVFAELKGVSDELLDLRSLIVSSLSGENTSRLVRLFQRIGAKELSFIIYSGAIFGVIIGGVQAALWSVFDHWWLAPVVGGFVGTFTNWLAIQMVFRPRERRRFLGVVSYQGMFAARQAEIARDYGATTADEVLTPKNLIRLVTSGEAGEKIAQVVSETISRRVEEEWQKLATAVPVRVEPAHLRRIQSLITTRVVSRIPELAPELESYLARKLDIARTIEAKLASLEKAEFERVLRGIFEEDEAILIAIGGVLGAAMGLGQAAWMLSQGMG